MKIKTAEITGPALDWAVARVIAVQQSEIEGGWRQYFLNHYTNHMAATRDFSTNWAHGGPIIEREAISLFSIDDYEWAAAIGATQYQRDQMKGPTALIAALRCFVASKLGTEIDVPEELVA